MMGIGKSLIKKEQPSANYMEALVKDEIDTDEEEILKDISSSTHVGHCNEVSEKSESSI